MTLLRVSSALLMALVGLTDISALYGEDITRVPLRNSRIEVEATYARLGATDMATRREIYGSLPDAMKEDLWTVQLEYFITDHPDLTAAQRSVAYEAIGLLATGGLQATESVAALQSRAYAVFSKNLLNAAFVNLGSPDGAVAMLRAGSVNEVSEQAPRPVHASWLCDCNTDPQQDFCGADLGPAKCLDGRRVCTFTSGCGWWWSYACDGYCSG